MPAQERIKEAFWKLLEENDYTNITISMLAKSAGVNHNTIYRYYKNIDELALALFDETLLKVIPGQLIEAYRQGDTGLLCLLQDPNIIIHWRRACLFFRNNSSLLCTTCRKKLRNIWLKELGINAEILPIEEQAELDFIFSGLAAVAGTALVHNDATLIAALLKRPVAQSILNYLASMKNNHVSQNSNI